MSTNARILTGLEPVLLITTTREVRSLALRSKDFSLIRSGVSLAHSIAGDYDDRLIYGAEKRNDYAGIFKSTFHGGAYDTVVFLGMDVSSFICRPVTCQGGQCFKCNDEYESRSIWRTFDLPFTEMGERRIPLCQQLISHPDCNGQRDW